jgi:hypothetical protein
MNARIINPAFFYCPAAKEIDGISAYSKTIIKKRLIAGLLRAKQVRII